MHIFVDTTSYEVDPSMTYETLCYQIENQTFVPVGTFRLTKVGGGGLIDMEEDDTTDMTLEALGIQADDILSMTLQVNAGMRRKWKKKRMRRLRRKRRKMRQRAR
jgi:Ribosomal protein L41